VFLALIADTHLPRGDRRLTDSCLDVLRAVDLIVHAGDFSESSVLADLRTLGPVAAVHGNVDSAQRRIPDRSTKREEEHGVAQSRAADRALADRHSVPARHRAVDQ
jgi:putative phosphoesterase